MVNTRFGKLIVVSYAGRERWNCLCACGKVREAKESKLRNGRVISCGCTVTAAQADARQAARKVGRLRKKLKEQAAAK